MYIWSSVCSCENVHYAIVTTSYEIVSCHGNPYCLLQPMRWTIPGSKIDKQQKLVDGPHASVYKVRSTSLCSNIRSSEVLTAVCGVLVSIHVQGTLFQDDGSNREVAIKELKASLDVNLEHSSVAVSPVVTLCFTCFRPCVETSAICRPNG